jgi:hypothetical protein
MFVSPAPPPAPRRPARGGGKVEIGDLRLRARRLPAPAPAGSARRPSRRRRPARGRVSTSRGARRKGSGRAPPGATASRRSGVSPRPPGRVRDRDRPRTGPRFGLRRRSCPCPSAHGPRGRWETRQGPRAAPRSGRLPAARRCGSRTRSRPSRQAQEALPFGAQVGRVEMALVARRGLGPGLVQVGAGIEKRVLPPERAARADRVEHALHAGGHVGS